MKFKKIFKQFLLASVIAFFLSLINLNLYNSNPVPTINSTVSNISQTSQISQFSFAPSFGIERGHASWLSSGLKKIGDALSDGFAVLVGLHNALIGGIKALWDGESVARGWNCDFYDTANRQFFGGETCKNSESGEVVRVCKSDPTKITPNTLEGRRACPAAKHICKFGWSEAEQLRSEAEQLRIENRIYEQNTEVNSLRDKLYILNTQLTATETELYELRWVSAFHSNKLKLLGDKYQLNEEIDSLTEKRSKARNILKRLHTMNKKKNIVYYHPDLRNKKENKGSPRISIATADLACKQAPNHAPTTSVK